MYDTQKNIQVPSLQTLRGEEHTEKTIFVQKNQGHDLFKQVKIQGITYQSEI